LVDDQSGITVYHEALDIELHGAMEAVETCLVFGIIIRGREMNLKYMSKLIIGGSDEKNARPGTFEVHPPMLGAIGWDRILDLSPFSNEVGQNLRFDGRLASLLRRISPSGNSETTVIL
jgi:hypothetical protein